MAFLMILFAGLSPEFTTTSSRVVDSSVNTAFSVYGKEETEIVLFSVLYPKN